MEDVRESLLEVELRNRRDGRAVAAFLDDFAHGVDDFRETIQAVVITHHLRVGRQSAARHRRQRDALVRGLRFRRKHVFVHAVFEDFLSLQNLRIVDVERVFRAFEGVPHRQDVGLARAAGHGAHGQVDDFRTGFDGGHVAGDAHVGGVMRMDVDRAVLAAGGVQHFAAAFDGFAQRSGRAGTGSVFEAQGVELHGRSENLLENVAVEFRGVGVGVLHARRKGHQRDGRFMAQTRVIDAVAREFKVADVVQCVKVTNGRNAVLLEHLRMQVNHFGGLRVQTDDIDTTGQRLEVDVRADRLADFVHHVKGVLAAVEEGALETRAAGDFEIGRAGFHRGAEGRQEVFCDHAGANDGLETVTE